MQLFSGYLSLQFDANHIPTNLRAADAPNTNNNSNTNHNDHTVHNFTNANTNTVTVQRDDDLNYSEIQKIFAGITYSKCWEFPSVDINTWSVNGSNMFDGNIESNGEMSDNDHNDNQVRIVKFLCILFCLLAGLTVCFQT